MCAIYNISICLYMYDLMYIQCLYDYIMNNNVSIYDVCLCIIYIYIYTVFICLYISCVG